MNEKDSNPALLEDLVKQLRRYAPGMPAILAVQLLSSALQDQPVVKKSWLLRALFGNRISLASLLALSAVALKDMRDATVEQFRDELNSYAGFSRRRVPSNPFVVVQIGDDQMIFTDIDVLARFLGSMSVYLVPDRASRSFDAARRAVISGWNDAYLLRAAEFMATRSIEQSMHELFGDKVNSFDPERVTGISKTLDHCLSQDGVPKPGAERFVEYVLRAIPKATNLHETLKTVIDQRDKFAHRCQADEEVARLDLAPFQLAHACLQYRSQFNP
ncbi:hypothetical protein GALL_309180 [mine drainage metagenome]|uniref:Uncharacterized protein n=1 Tax=mine drainage metagenome TaxID=410659 RepID=A0A1J5QU89_9ZZZZ